MVYRLDLRRSAARPRAWRVQGVAIWPDKREAQTISTGQFAKRARSRAAGRKQARGRLARKGRAPWTRACSAPRISNEGRRPERQTLLRASPYARADQALHRVMPTPMRHRVSAMRNLYHVSPKDDFKVYVAKHAARWVIPNYAMRTVGPNQDGVFFVAAEDAYVGHVGQWGLIRPGQPERIDYLPSKVPGKRGRPRSTNNARIEGIEKKVTFKAAWTAGRRCLVPAAWYQEPNWETSKNIWWQFKRADGMPWMLAGLWSEWTDMKTGELVPNFTLLTTNCDSHPLLNRLHKPDPVLPPDAQDKRSLIHVDQSDWETWLRGRLEDVLPLIRPPAVEAFDLTDAIRTDEALAALGR